MHKKTHKQNMHLKILKKTINFFNEDLHAKT